MSATTAAPARLAVLLVEDSPADARLLREMLAEMRESRYDLVWVDRLGEALQYLGSTPFDIVLLDLMLPDSQEVETLQRLHQEFPDIPVIVLTGLDDEALDRRLAEAGAQDYLVKAQLNQRVLERAIRYAVERRRLLTELEQSRLSDQQDRELRSLERLSGANATSSITAQMFGLAPLRESVPNIFYELVLQYENLLDLALEQRAYRVEHNLNERLRFMAERIGFLNAGPRDVVEIHASALKRKTSEAHNARAQAYIEEARVMVLELMGYLVSFYRNYSLGSRRFPARDPQPGS